MILWPLPGVPGKTLSVQLREVAVSARNVIGRSAGPDQLAYSYLQWATESHRLLRHCMRQSDIKRYVLTDRYWATLANSSNSRLLSAILLDEMTHVANMLEETSRIFDQELSAWTEDHESNPSIAYVVPDTNVFLHHPAQFREIDWQEVLCPTGRSLTTVRLVIPILVIDELDAHKRTEARSRARQTLKGIYEDFGNKVDSRRLLQPMTEGRGEVTMQLLFDPPSHIRLPIADEELLDRASAVQSLLAHPVEFVTYDTGAALRAAAVGLRHHRLSGRQT